MVKGAVLTLGQKQRLFTRLMAELIEWAYDQGYELTFGDAYRDPRLHGQHGESGGYGAKGSCHKLRLAVDLNLFKDGEFLEQTEDHLPLGQYWETLHPSCVWGGKFKDGNHYSFEHNGFK